MKPLDFLVTICFFVAFYLLGLLHGRRDAEAAHKKIEERPGRIKD